MTKAVFTKQNGLWTSLKVSGHSGYANHGSDIVCAGISTAVISSINLLDKLIGERFEVIQNEKEGLIFVTNINYNGIDSKEVDFVGIIFENLYQTLNSIEEEYPKNLKIKIENNK